eukprot:jgi/Bigna1/85650/estExt_fgenesh1_pg.C_50127
MGLHMVCQVLRLANLLSIVLLTTSAEILKRSPHGDELADELFNDRVPIARRMQHLFELRSKGAQGNEKAIQEMKTGIRSKSVLLRHEVAYLLGQMQHKKSIPFLVSILNCTEEHPIVRHEAAEALGAIGDPLSESILKVYTDANSPVEVSDTCKLALSRLAWLREQREQDGIDQSSAPSRQRYISIDPAPPLSSSSSAVKATTVAVDRLGERLLDKSLSLFERYKAMFSLRVRWPKGFQDKNAVLRHELAFVLGQMACESAVSYLRERLQDEGEHAMVRHEAAEALGAILTSECKTVLQQYLSHPNPLVRESCEVALDMYLDEIGQN